VNKEAAHYVQLFGGNRARNFIVWLPFVFLYKRRLSSNKIFCMCYPQRNEFTNNWL